MRDPNLIREVYFRPYLQGQGPSFRLRLFDDGENDGRGRSCLRYTLELKTGPKYIILFTGSDFSPSPCYSIGGDDSVKAIMGFLTLRPGDTDSEYFDAYTPGQLAFCDAYAETLSCEVYSRFGG